MNAEHIHALAYFIASILKTLAASREKSTRDYLQELRDYKFPDLEEKPKRLRSGTELGIYNDRVDLDQAILSYKEWQAEKRRKSIYGWTGYISTTKDSKTKI